MRTGHQLTHLCLACVDAQSLRSMRLTKESPEKSSRPGDLEVQNIDIGTVITREIREENDKRRKWV